MTDQLSLLEQLRQPFPPEAISWLPGATKGDKCMAMAYADLRAYMERLDDICGLDWNVTYEPWGDSRIIARLTIAGSTRCSTGEYDAQDAKSNIAGTVAEAQSFKRAAAMFGLGRYLYELPAVWVAFDAASKKISKEGQAELDKRYAAWYAKTLQKATDATKAPQGVVDTLKHESPPHQRLWGQGMAVFGKDWDMARGWLISKWTARETPDNTRNSAAELSNDEKTQLGDYMVERASALQKAWPKQKAIIEKATA